MSSAFMGTGKADCLAQNGNSPDYMSYFIDFVFIDFATVNQHRGKR